MNVEEIKEFIERQNVAIISSIDEDGFPNTRAMLPPRKIEAINTYYFTTNTSSLKVKHFKNNDKACLYFFNKGLLKYVGVMFEGNVEVLQDEKIKKEIWKTGDNIYYPKGVNDPDYCVLKFTASTCKFYSNLEIKDIKI